MAETTPEMDNFLRLAREVWPYVGTPADKARAEAFMEARERAEQSIGWTYTEPSTFQREVMEKGGWSIGRAQGVGE